MLRNVIDEFQKTIFFNKIKEILVLYYHILSICVQYHITCKTENLQGVKTIEIICFFFKLVVVVMSVKKI